MDNASPACKALLYSIWIGVALLLLTPLIVTTNTLFPFIVGKALYARTLINIILGLWVILAYINPDYRPRRSRLLLLFAVYVFISLIAGLFGVSPQRSIWSTYERMQGVVDLGHWFLLTVVLSSTIGSVRNWRFLLNVNLGVSVVVGLIGVGQVLGFENIPLYKFLETAKRLDITLGNATFVGAYMLVNVLVGLGLFTQSFQRSNLHEAPQPARTRRRARNVRRKRIDFKLHSMRAFWLTAVALDFTMLTLTGTRGALAGLVIGLLAFTIGYLFVGRSNVLKYITVGATGVVFSALLLLLLARDTDIVRGIADSNITAKRIVQTKFDDAPIKSRLAAFSIGYNAFADRPLLGWGPENYLVPYGRFFDPDTMTIETLDQAHNKIIEELTTKGILGLFSYLALWFLVVRVIYTRARTADNNLQVLILFVGAALTGYFVQNLFLFDTPAVVLQLMLLLGFVIYMERSPQALAAAPSGGEEKKAGIITTMMGSPLSTLSSRLSARFQSMWLNSRTVGRLRELSRHRVLSEPSLHMYGSIVRYAVVFTSLLITLVIAVSDDTPYRVATIATAFPWVASIAAFVFIRKYFPRFQIDYRASFVAVAVFVFVSFLAFMVNFRAYEAASVILRVSDPRITAETAMGHFGESIDKFGPLANYSRLIMFRSLSANWGSLSQLQAEEATRVVDRESKQAIASEPENWRLQIALSEFYQRASSLNPKYIKVAGSFLETSLRLAPERHEVLDLVAEQEKLELTLSGQ